MSPQISNGWRWDGMDEAVRIRDFIDSDADIIFGWICDKELRKMTGTRGEPNMAGHRIWFQNKKEDKTNIHKMITYLGLPVGIIGTNEINPVDRNADLYIYIGNESWRKKGIASSALNTFCDLLLQKYGCHKLTASIRSFNAPSIALFEKNGFTCEGIQREQVLYDGVFYDRLLYGKVMQ